MTISHGLRLAIVAAFLAGCAAAATPSPNQTPSATPEPTMNAGLEGYQAFLSHVRDSHETFLSAYRDQFVAAMQRWVADSNAFADVATTSLTLQTLANDEIAWLDGNPPAPCYAVTHRLYRSAVQNYADGGHYLATAFEHGALASDAATIELGLKSMKAGNDEQASSATSFVSC